VYVNADGVVYAFVDMVVDVDANVSVNADMHIYVC